MMMMMMIYTNVVNIVGWGWVGEA